MSLFDKNLDKYLNNCIIDTDLKLRIISYMSLVFFLNIGNTSEILQLIPIFKLRIIECMSQFDVS